MQTQIRTPSGYPVMTHILDVKLTFNVEKFALNIFKLILHTVFNNEARLLYVYLHVIITTCFTLVSCLEYFLALKIEAISCSET
jgi:hypothetical protein